ncbi:hypothetical protein YC2023_025655 [Brassica napus]
MDLMLLRQELYPTHKEDIEEQNTGIEGIKKDDLVEENETKEEAIGTEEGKQQEVNKDKEDRDKGVENAKGEVNVVRSPTYCDIVKSPSNDVISKAVQKSTKADLVNNIRPSLPRSSKANHKVFPEKPGPAVEVHGRLKKEGQDVKLLYLDQATIGFYLLP